MNERNWRFSFFVLYACLELSRINQQNEFEFQDAGAHCVQTHKHLHSSACLPCLIGGRAIKVPD